MSPASRLLQSAQSTVRSPFEPEQQTPLLDRSKDLIPNWITSQAHTSSPSPLASPTSALVPSASAEGEDLLAHKLTLAAPISDTATPIGPIAPIPLPASTLDSLLRAESTLSNNLAILDPLSPAFTFALQNLASLRYHIAAEIAQQAALQNPKFTKDLIKATAIVQRDHHRLAREAAAKEREHNRRQRERDQDTRYKQRQQDTELKFKRKLELAKLAIEKLDKKAQQAQDRDNRTNYTTKNTEPNSHNQSRKSVASRTQSVSSPDLLKPSLQVNNQTHAFSPT